MILKLGIQFFQLLMAVLLVSIVNGCAVNDIQKSAPLNPKATWVMLPLLNYSDSPEAGERIADIVATILRAQHGVHLLEAQAPTAESALPELNQQKNLSAAVNWGKEQHYQYGVSGSVQEWRYKSGLDGEPAVGITLKVIDLNSGAVLWSASGSKTGWGRESVSGAGHKLIAQLLDGLAFSE